MVESEMITDLSIEISFLEEDIELAKDQMDCFCWGTEYDILRCVINEDRREIRHNQKIISYLRAEESG